MIFKKIIFNKVLAKILVKPLVFIHSWSYKLVGVYVTILNNGSHPKHGILQYDQWFLSQVQEGWAVLDVGCNKGFVSNTLASKAKLIYGIDNNLNLITKAKEEAKKTNVHFLFGDATSFDYSDCEKIDCVILSNVLEHIENRQEFLVKLQDQVRWNNPQEKVFLLRVPLLTRDWISVYKKEIGSQWRLDSTHFTEYTREQFYDEMESAGLKVFSCDIRFGEIYAICKNKVKRI